MGRKSISGGVMRAGPGRIRFDFTVDGRRFRPTLPWIPNERISSVHAFTSHGLKRKLRPVYSAFPTSSHGTVGCRNCLLPSNIERVEMYSMTLFATRRLVWHEAIWPQPRSPRIERSSTTSGDLTWQRSRSWVFAIDRSPAIRDPQRGVLGRETRAVDTHVD